MPQDWDPGGDMRKVLDETVRAVFGDHPPAPRDLHAASYRDIIDRLHERPRQLPA